MPNSNKAVLKEIPIEKITRSPYQPRRAFDQEALEELAQSIRSNGLLQPILVREISNEKYELIAGERRWRATQLVGLTTITCLVYNYSDEQAADATTIENLQREDLNPIEEAQAYLRLIDDFSYSHEDLARIVGKSRVKITNALRLLKLNSKVQELLISKQLSVGHGKALAGLEPNQQYMIAMQILKQEWSVRKTEREVKKIIDAANAKTVDDKDPNIIALEKGLTEHIGCNVNIDFDSGKGKMHIDFYNIDILQGLLDKLGFDQNK